LTVGLMFTGYFVLWFETKLSSEITIYERWIVRNRGGRQKIRFSRLMAFSWHTRAEFSVMVLTDRRGRQFFVGVPPGIDRERLLRFLASRIPIGDYCVPPAGFATR
jgi:hypothetical protein